MKSNLIKNTLKGIGLSVFMAAGLIVFSGTEANAQYQNRDNNQNRRDDRRDRRRERQDDYNRNRDNDRRNNDGYYGNNPSYGNDAYNVARQEGYRDGLTAGRDDARDGERYKPQSHSDYKRGTDGYNSRYGNKGQYKQAYRDAFIQGYEQGYNRNNRNNQRNNDRYGY